MAKKPATDDAAAPTDQPQGRYRLKEATEITDADGTTRRVAAGTVVRADDDQGQQWIDDGVAEALSGPLVQTDEERRAAAAGAEEGDEEAAGDDEEAAGDDDEEAEAPAPRRAAGAKKKKAAKKR